MQPLQGILLIGGRSKRMGQPKALIEREGRPLGRILCELLLETTGCEPILLGEGSIGPDTGHYHRLSDRVPGKGPLSAILGAYDHDPELDYLILACDMWALDRRGLGWLVEQGTQGQPVTWPKMPNRNMGEPLCSIYSRSAGPLLEIAWQKGVRSLLDAIPPQSRFEPVVPPELYRAFTNVNNPEQLQAIKEGRAQERDLG